MTQAQYAAHRSDSRQYIGNLAKRGVLVMRGRLVDVPASDAVLDDKPKTATINEQPTSYAQARPAPNGPPKTTVRGMPGPPFLLSCRL